MTDTNTQTQPQKSVMDCVKEFIAANPNAVFTIDDLCKIYTDKPKPQLAHAVWMLRTRGVVARGADGKHSVLTDVNKPVGNPKPTKKAKRKVKPVVKPVVKKVESKDASNLKWQVAELEKQMRRADMAYEELAVRQRTLQSTHDTLREMHTDALAVIRYLENKLYVALQQVVKNGSNA